MGACLRLLSFSFPILAVLACGDTPSRLPVDPGPDQNGTSDGGVTLEASVSRDASASDSIADAPVDVAGPDLRKLRYFLVPHPDDEAESFALLDADHYPVFILLTQGEETQFCNRSGLNGDSTGFEDGTGERRPLPTPFGLKWSRECALQRVDSFNFFFSEIAAATGLGNATLIGRRTSTEPATVEPVRCDAAPPCVLARDFDLYIGKDHARVVFDLGDGDLTEAEVAWALASTRAIRSSFPVQREDDAVAAGYRNARATDGAVYDHRDHAAIHVSLFQTNHGLPGGQWGRTAEADPDVTLRGELAPSLYKRMFEVGAGVPPMRIGAHPVAYGWLASPFYPGCEVPLDGTAGQPFCIWSRKQSFWKRF